MEGSLSRAKDYEALASEVQTYPEVEDLLRQALECVSKKLTPGKVPPSNEATPEVLLDIQIDDNRYILIRSYPLSSQPKVHLSPREHEIVRLVAKGHPNKVIAMVLDISPWTVSTHLRRIFSKLRVSSRAEMVARVLAENLLTIPN